MLDHIFGSRTRVKLLRLFLVNPDVKYYVRELTRKIDERINSVRRELENLEEIGLIGSEQTGQKKYYKVNTDFTLYPELRSLLLKSQLIIERDLSRSVKQIGQISYLVLTGIFTGATDTKTDILVVGRVNRPKLKRLLNKFRKDFDHNLRYTVMTRKEFEYRNDLTDKFLFNILEKKKIVVVDNLFKH